ncbi:MULTISPECIES: hybrid sensor histidine kinase/response regulator transcription factor [unclassified Sphingobacterium]|uniref:hybrid sensor histidine kinase/response regulator transcription factor n=1 Tax=unclassified Sphingobacterium TaxID=2609468 RepID=UPI0025CECFA9|nr:MULTISPECIES: hybrid sensor histidine kinase/response regulator transcription factor [unclassified Sphingobacterium]
MNFLVKQIQHMVIIVWLFCPLMSCLAQNFNFETLTQDNVLDKQAVLTIAQDKKGKLWFGGGDNLFVYDSQTIVNLRVQDSIFNKLDYINKICINDKDDLFIATATQVFIFNIDKRKAVLKRGKPFIEKLVVSDIQILSGHIFLCTNRGLYVAVPASGSYDFKLILDRPHTQAIVQTGLDSYTIASSDGIESFTYKNKRISQTHNLGFPLLPPKERIFSTMHFKDNTLWVGTKLHGLFLFNFSSGNWRNLSEENSNLLSNNVRKIIRNANGELLIGTLKGLSIFNGSPVFTNYKHNTSIKNSLSQNSIYDIFMDNQKVIWLGTYFGGINAVYPDLIPIQTYSTRSLLNRRLNSDIIGSFAVSKNAYWIGTEEEGINKIDKITGNTSPQPKFTRSNLIKDLYIRDEKLYAAQYGGGYSVIDLKSGNTKNFFLEKDLLNLKNNIYSIYVDPAQRIYLGTNKGLYIAEQEKPPHFDSSLAANTIDEIQADDKQQIYLLQSGKLFRKKNFSATIHPIKQVSSLYINGFYVAPNGNVWITSKGDLYHFDLKDRLTLTVGFPNNTLGWPIMIDGHFWISSKNGLIFFNPTTKYTTTLNQYDGLPVKNMQGAKVYKNEAGMLFVTTLNGLVSIDTRKITFNQAKPNVLFRNIFLEDSPLNYGRLQKDEKSNSYQLQLRHDENFITVNFSSSNFIKPLKNRYRYKLEGFDKDWIETSTPSVRYTNIPEGQHTLTIYASNNDGIWSDTPLQIHLDIKPPLWRTWWAYLLYAGLFALGVHFIIKFVVERQMLINSERDHEKKIKFFTQISHEIRTPLTLITAPLDEIISETANLSSTQSKIKRIKKNATKLLGVVNELLDFKKFDDKHFVLKPNYIPFREYIEDTFYLLNDLAQNKHINYYIRQLDSVGLQFIDTVQFDKVMFNLLSNAIKYTPENGTVYLELIDNKDNTIINIVDNGIGIATENQFKIFEEYYREEQANDTIGTGIGLALTKQIVQQHQGEVNCSTTQNEKGKWTVFSVHLPKSDSKAISLEEPFPSTTEDPTPVTPFVLDNSLRQTLLIVEDNRELLDTIVRLFQESYTIITAVNGEDALSKAQAYIPDLILSDLMMPYMNGAQLCQAIKTTIVTSHIPVILLTAVTDSNSQTQALQYGANIYLTKPFDNRQLFLSVQNLLAISHKKSREFHVKKTDFDNELDAQFIATLDQLIEANIQSADFDVNFISRNMGMSAPIIYRKLRAISNLSINNYVKMYRLNKAKTLLKSSMNISEVAYAVGFSERKYFSREFKKQFGHNPSEEISQPEQDS